VTRRLCPARRGVSIVETMLATSLLFFLVVAVFPAGYRLARHHGALKAHADDLRRGAALADRLAAEVRAAEAVVLRSPDERVRTGVAAVVLRRPGGEVRAVSVEPTRRRTGLVVLERFDAAGRSVGREVLGVTGRLDLGYDASAPAAVRLVRVDVVFPRREEGAREAVLSTAAAVAAGEAAP